MKKGNKKAVKNDQVKNNKLTIAIVGVAVILLIVLLLIFSETVISGKITVSNETNFDIDKVSVSFDNSNSELLLYYVDMEEYHSGDLFVASVKAGETVKGNFSSLNMYMKDAELCVDVNVDGESTVYYSGEFNSEYKGKIHVRLYEEDGNVMINIRAVSGVFGLFSKLQCDVTYYFED